MADTQKKRFIYFVRHGESEGNVASRVQSPDEPLTEEGKKQAAYVGKRFAKEIAVDHIFCSSMLRTKETAAIAAEEMGFTKEIEYSNLLIERLSPTEFVGLPRSDEKYIAYYKEYMDHWADAQWSYSDGESFFNLQARARMALDYIATLPHEHTLVVTHGLFLRFLVGEIVFKENFSPQMALGLIDNTKTNNTGITAVTYEESEGFVLLTYNDYAHLPK